MMAKIAVLGQGLMGAAVARKLLQSGLEIIVWNRTAQKCEPLIALGASVASSARSAIESAETVILLTANCTDIGSYLEEPERALAGRDVINFVTASPAQARVLETFVLNSGARIINGVIQGFPSDIGKSTTVIAVGGDEDLWKRHESLLRLLAGSAQYVGASVALPSVLDAAVMGGFLIGAMSGFLEAVSYALKDGADLECLTPVFQSAISRIPARAEQLLRDIAETRFVSADATLEIYLRSMALYGQAFTDARASNHLIRANIQRIEDAIAAGDGQSSFAALIRH